MKLSVFVLLAVTAWTTSWGLTANADEGVIQFRARSASQCAKALLPSTHQAEVIPIEPALKFVAFKKEMQRDLENQYRKQDSSRPQGPKPLKVSEWLPYFQNQTPGSLPMHFNLFGLRMPGLLSRENSEAVLDPRFSLEKALVEMKVINNWLNFGVANFFFDQVPRGDLRTRLKDNSSPLVHNVVMVGKEDPAAFIEKSLTDEKRFKREISLVNFEQATQDSAQLVYRSENRPARLMSKMQSMLKRDFKMTYLRESTETQAKLGALYSQVDIITDIGAESSLGEKLAQSHGLLRDGGYLLLWIPVAKMNWVGEWLPITQFELSRGADSREELSADEFFRRIPGFELVNAYAKEDILNFRELQSAELEARAADRKAGIASVKGWVVMLRKNQAQGPRVDLVKDTGWEKTAGFRRISLEALRAID